jgi:DNA invertase Pin-like site-specific DNA recombinase
VANPAHIYSEAESGSEWRHRPKLQALLEAARRGEFDRIIFYAFDRLSRKQTDTAVILNILSEAGILYESVTEEFDTSPVGQFMVNVKAFAAELENVTRVERSVRGKYTRIASGKIHGHSADLYGYRRNKEAGVRIIFESEAMVVRRMYEWVALDRLSVRAVIKRLNAEEYSTPSASGNKRTYKDGRTTRWGRGTVYRILTEPAYKGETILWRYKSQGKHKLHTMRPESEWLRLDGVTPAIVTNDLWNAVQEQLPVTSGDAARNEARPYLLRGMVVCAVCGLPMRTQPERNVRVYRCASREKPAGPCGGWRPGPVPGSPERRCPATRRSRSPAARAGCRHRPRPRPAPRRAQPPRSYRPLPAPSAPRLSPMHPIIAVSALASPVPFATNSIDGAPTHESVWTRTRSRPHRPEGAHAEATGHLGNRLLAVVSSMYDVKVDRGD